MCACSLPGRRPPCSVRRVFSAASWNHAGEDLNHVVRIVCGGIACVSLRPKWIQQRPGEYAAGSWKLDCHFEVLPDGNVILCTDYDRFDRRWVEAVYRNSDKMGLTVAISDWKLIQLGRNMTEIAPARPIFVDMADLSTHIHRFSPQCCALTINRCQNAPHTRDSVKVAHDTKGQALCCHWSTRAICQRLR